MGQAIMANIDKMAVMTWLYRVMKSTNIGVYAKETPTRDNPGNSLLSFYFALKTS